MFLRLALHVENATESNSCGEIFGLLHFTSYLGRSLRRRDENGQELGVPREGGTLFTLGNTFYLCLRQTEYTPSISNAEQGMQKIVEHEAGKEQ